MKESVISWTLPNTFTIGIMLIFWLLVIGVLAKMAKNYQARKGNA